MNDTLSHSRKSLGGRDTDRRHVRPDRMRQQRSNKGWRGTNVGIDGENPCRAWISAIETDLETMDFPIPARRYWAGVHHAYSTVAGGECRHEILSAIARSAIDGEDLGDFAGLGDQSGQAGAQPAALVQDWNQNRDPLLRQ